MYTEGFDDLERFDEKSTRRAYVSNVPQDEAERLLRENEELKKALEKEQFFNKLLDQEIQELKSKQGPTEPHLSPYWYGNRGVSKGAFYTLLFVALGMAGYIGYGIYHQKQFNYINDISPNGTVTSDEAAPTFTTPSGNNQGNMSGEPQPRADEAINNTTPMPADQDDVVQPSSGRPAVKDSVPNIVARQQQQNNTAEEREPPAPERNKAVQEIDVENTKGVPAAEAVDTRPVIARYRISSKANFYSSPDEDAMRNTFISQGDDKIVGALEDRNGFIYVVYTNDLGYTSRGWLSKKDLTKLD